MIYLLKQTTISNKNYGKNYCLGNFVFLPIFLLMLRDNENNLRPAIVMGIQHYIEEEGDLLNTVFKIPIILCH